MSKSKITNKEPLVEVYTNVTKVEIKNEQQDDNVTNLLNYYELINELKTIHG